MVGAETHSGSLYWTHLFSEGKSEENTILSFCKYGIVILANTFLSVDRIKRLGLVLRKKNAANFDYFKRFFNNKCTERGLYTFVLFCKRKQDKQTNKQTLFHSSYST